MFKIFPPSDHDDRNNHEIDPEAMKQRDRLLVRYNLRIGRSAYKALKEQRQHRMESPSTTDPEVVRETAKMHRMIDYPNEEVTEEARSIIRDGILPGISALTPGLKNSPMNTVPKATPEPSPSTTPEQGTCRFCGVPGIGIYPQCKPCYDKHVKLKD